MDLRAIVTGASSGIGYETAKLLCQKGARVLSVARRFERLVDLEQQTPPGIIPCAIDITVADAPAMILRDAETKLGGLDLLINNAGPAWVGPFMEMPTDEIDQILQTDVRALMLLCRTAVPLLECSTRGQIINVGSAAAHSPMALMAVYSAAKAAVVAFSEALGKELKDRNIRINVLSPTGTDTEIFEKVGVEPQKEKLIDPADMAKLILMMIEFPPTLDVAEIRTQRRLSPPM